MRTCYCDSFSDPTVVLSFTSLNHTISKQFAELLEHTHDIIFLPSPLHNNELNTFSYIFSLPCKQSAVAVPYLINDTQTHFCISSFYFSTYHLLHIFISSVNLIDVGCLISFFYFLIPFFLPAYFLQKNPLHS